MRKLVIFTISLMLLLGSIVNICAIAQDSDELEGDGLKEKQVKNINLKNFEKGMTVKFKNEIWMPIKKEFYAENYLVLIPVLKKYLESDNTYIQNNKIVLNYYLALCYHNLGYTDKAREEYEKVCSSGEGTDLAFYSKKAMACMDDPNSPACTGKKKEKKPELSELEKAQQDEIKQLRQQVTKLQNELAEAQKQLHEIFDSISCAPAQEATDPSFEERLTKIEEQLKLLLEKETKQNGHSEPTKVMAAISDVA